MNPEPPLGNKCGTRLFLYVTIAVIPVIGEWLTLTYDTSSRGILILLFKALLIAATTWRAYIDNGGNPTPPLSRPPADTTTKPAATTTTLSTQ